MAIFHVFLDYAMLCPSLTLFKVWKLLYNIKKGYLVDGLSIVPNR